jgi:hypothetical protein
MPGVVALELLFGDDRRVLGELVSRLPGLRRLDLSRNGFRTPSILPIVEELGRIEHLVLPSLRSEDDLQHVRRLLERYPGLEITVSRMYVANPSEPRLHVLAPRIWREDYRRDEVLRIRPPDTHVVLTSLIGALAPAWDTLPADARAAWVEFWMFVEEAPFEDEDDVLRPFDTVTLLRAFESIPDEIRCAEVVHELRAQPLPPTVRITRDRTW